MGADAPAASKLASEAKKATTSLAALPTEAKDRALADMAEALERSMQSILDANRQDVEAARAAGLADALVARLALDERKVKAMAASVRQIASLADPVGKLIESRRRPNGLEIRKVRVPIGVILIIYESRPNVTADCMALCLKSGNAVLLKGGSEAHRSNDAIYIAMKAAAMKTGVHPGAFGYTSERADAKALLQMDDLVDLVIPRGGEGLIRSVAAESRVPVIKHYKGVCHVFVDRKADLAKAEAIVVNAKLQNPSVCNAMETLLVDRSLAASFLPKLAATLREKGLKKLRADRRTLELVPGLAAEEMGEEDFHIEYLDRILAVRVVDGLDEAVAHIRRYGSMHSDAIVTEDRAAADRFVAAVDSACVFVNCSTRFNDGGEFGMGAEMGISTDKLHARGPMGLEELTTYKYVVTGDGQVRG